MFHSQSVFICNFLIVQAVYAGTWYNWSGWNECTKSCDGGLTNRKRICYGGNCIGSDTQYKLCNTQGCLSNDILSEHDACLSYYGNNGRNLDLRQKYQCSVFCADSSKQLPYLVNVNLSDGTKCSRQQNHYCIKGKCYKLGCDGVVGSDKVIDDCGICGGDGTICQAETSSKQIFVWEVQRTFCSVSCGTGFQRSRVICRNTKYNRIIPNLYCNYNNKPAEVTKECSAGPCDPGWKRSSWEDCSVPCGGGVQKRKVACIHVTGRAKEIQLPDYRCPDPIPPSEKSCNTRFCPTIWQTGPWTKCSVTCGVGVQGRPVYCSKSMVRGMYINVSNSECMGPKPTISRPCSQPPCFKMLSFSPHIKQDNFTFIQLKKSKTIRLKIGVKAILLPRQPVKFECPVENFDKTLLLWTKNSRLISTSVHNRVHVTSRGALKIRRTDPLQDAGTYTCMAGIESGSVILEFQSKKTARREAKKIRKKLLNKTHNEIINKPQADVIPGSGPQNIVALPSDKSLIKNSAVYMTSDWSKCSRTCGYGFQTRKVTCNIIKDKYMKIVPDNQCSDKIPEYSRVCVDNPYCPVWRSGNWSQCSTETCIYDGIAEKTREVFCEAENNQTIILPPKKCDQNNRPETRRQCHNEKCVSVWKASKWTTCKPRCAKTGKKTRILSCVWKHNKKSARDNCKSKPKPVLRKICKPKYCKRKCYDSSRYCSITKLLRMCRYRTFRDRCCATCNNSVST